MRATKADLPSSPRNKGMSGRFALRFSGRVARSRPSSEDLLPVHSSFNNHSLQEGHRMHPVQSNPSLNCTVMLRWQGRGRFGGAMLPGRQGVRGGSGAVGGGNRAAAPGGGVRRACGKGEWRRAGATIECAELHAVRQATPDRHAARSSRSQAARKRSEKECGVFQHATATLKLRQAIPWP